MVLLFGKCGQSLAVNTKHLSNISSTLFRYCQYKMWASWGNTSANTKYFYNICTTLAQRLRRWSSIVQMFYKCFVFTGRIGIDYLKGNLLTDRNMVRCGNNLSLLAPRVWAGCENVNVMWIVRIWISKRLTQILGMSLVEMIISTNHIPQIWVTCYEYRPKSANCGLPFELWEWQTHQSAIIVYQNIGNPYYNAKTNNPFRCNHFQVLNKHLIIKGCRYLYK